MPGCAVIVLWPGFAAGPGQASAKETRELMWHERHLVGFENRLKDKDGVKAKVADSLAVKGRTVEQAMRLIPDAVRYAFQYHEADYRGHMMKDIALMQERHADLVRLGNFWRGDQYKGISSVWRHRDGGQLFEVQYHTEESYGAMVFTAGTSYARLRVAETCAQEALELEALQREIYSHVRVPPGADDIPGYPSGRDWRIPGTQSRAGMTYYAIVDDLSSRERPAGTFRRRYAGDGRHDEAFTQDLAWQFSSLLVSAERGDLENEFNEIAAEEAHSIADRIRRSAVSKPAS
jgi:hypothetical protein